jgi:transcription antitermination protein NusB
MGARRRAREHALMILYQIDLSGTPPENALERFWATYASGETLDPPPPFSIDVEPDAMGPPDDEVKNYAEELVRGVSNGRVELDELIQKVSHNWRLDRMACVDRNLLRLGAYELTVKQSEVPRKVAINEAVEIAKRFGTAESSAFINGILDRLGKDKGST